MRGSAALCHGAASYHSAEERRVRILKENGFNAIRCSHNPPSSIMLDVCDRMGMLVIDEIFDCWTNGKMAVRCRKPRVQCIYNRCFGRPKRYAMQNCLCAEMVIASFKLKYLHDGENTLRIEVDASCQPASRWYTGAGPYISADI